MAGRKLNIEFALLARKPGLEFLKKFKGFLGGISGKADAVFDCAPG